MLYFRNHCWSMSICFLVLLHMELTQSVNQILGENHQLLNILIIAQAFFNYLLLCLQ
jgi:hypothetical protein